VSRPDAPLILLDTNVWSVLHGVRRQDGGPDLTRWHQHLAGAVETICLQVRAEVLAGTRAWGPRRAAETAALLDQTPTYPIDEAVVQAYATLAYQARQSGHAIHQKIHDGDRWIAATAISLGIPLLSADKAFRGAPGLDLIDWWSAA